MERHRPYLRLLLEVIVWGPQIQCLIAKRDPICPELPDVRYCYYFFFGGFFFVGACLVIGFFFGGACFFSNAISLS